MTLRIIIIKAYTPVTRRTRKPRPLPPAALTLAYHARMARERVPLHVVKTSASKFKITGGSPLPNEWRVSVTPDGTLYRHTGKPEPRTDLSRAHVEEIKDVARYQGIGAAQRKHGEHLERNPHFHMWLSGGVRKSIRIIWRKKGAEC
jgi:hypothetical protein